MDNVPRIVRERLRNQAAVGEHPDANLLSAFAEHTLSEQERAQLLDHLSRCAECREVVALSALPQVEEERVAAGRVSATASRSWWRSPVVHWGALTAAALVVLIAVGERIRLREGHSASAPAIAQYAPAQRPEEQASEPAPATAEQKKSPGVAPAARTRLRADTVNAPSSAGAMGGVSGGNPTMEPAPAPPPAALPMKPHPSADASKIEGPLFDKERKIDQAQAKAFPVPPTASSHALEIVGSSGAAAKSAGKSQAAELSQGRNATFTMKERPSPRWTVSDSGAVERSFDGGRSWKEVAIADGVTFRAVATVGSDVWAGGSGGALYHSADGGGRWARVRVQASGRALGGDILRIEFADTQNGVVTTSTGESWATSDAGDTWHRQ